MFFYVVGVPFALLGLTMLVRGTIYTMRPDGPTAARRKKLNLQRGFTTDMALFGFKVRRLGLLLLLLGGFLLGWEVSHHADVVDVADVDSGPALPAVG